MKISAQEFDDAVAFLGMGPSGNTLKKSVQVCQVARRGWRGRDPCYGSFFRIPGILRASICP